MTRPRPINLHAFGLIFFLIGNSALFANNFSDPETHAYSNNYIYLEVARNHAFGDSQKEFTSGDQTLHLGFRHALKSNWIVGVTGGFKRFKRKSDEKMATLLGLGQESLYIVRLYHPTYLLIGPKVLYLQSTQGMKIPPERDPEYKREFGFGISTSIQHFLSKRFLVSFRFDRWRGVNRERFLANETAMGVVYSLP